MLSAYMDQFRAEYEKSPWLKYVLPVLFVLLTLYMLDALSVASAQKSQEYRQLLSREAKVSGLQEQADWQLAKQKAEQRYQELSKYVWKAESLELASADLQSVLRQLAKDKVTALRINIAPPEQTNVPDIWRLSAEVSGKLRPSQVPDMLIDSASKEPAISIERFTYLPARNQNGAMQVSILVSIEPASDNQVGAES